MGYKMDKNITKIEHLKSKVDRRTEQAYLNNITTQHQFEEILSEAADLRLAKVIQYGEERYFETDEEVQLWMTYCDVWRKFSRIRKLIKNILNNRDMESANKLRSDYLDLLNYGAMGVQIIDLLKLSNDKTEKE